MFEAKNFDHLLGLPGFSDQLLKNHFALYQGYVANTNKLTEELAGLLKQGKTSAPAYAELKRRFGWEFNGMRLHEHYFGALGKESAPPPADSPLYQKLEKDFGGFENWKKDFLGLGAMRGIGWAILYRDKTSDRLFNTWINEHDAGHLSGADPLLVMDVFEHAFMLDYGLKRGDYLEAFFRAVDWKKVASCF